MKMLIEVEININLETSEWTKESLFEVLNDQLLNIDLLEEDEYVSNVTTEERRMNNQKFLFNTVIVAITDFSVGCVFGRWIIHSLPAFQEKKK